MRLLYRHHIILLLAFFCCIHTAKGQALTGTKHIPGDYATISAAVTALNSVGPGAGGVIFNVAANYTETITATISITTTGTVANPITFQKDPATTGANPVITAYAGTATPASAAQDGIWRLLGSDYITINGIDLKDNNTTNSATMEYGYALYKTSATNGCQNVTIKNCVITLNRVNDVAGTAPMVDGSTGIIVMNALATAATTNITPTSAAGANSNNKFYSNTIQNCNTGIALIGYAAPSPFTLADVNNDIGGSSAATGNTIINYGGGASATVAAAGVRTLAQYGLNVSYNTINNNNGSGVNHPNTLWGIYANTATSASETITFNTITLLSSAATQAVSGIENAAGATAASNTVNISNNTLTNFVTSAANNTAGMTGIYNNGANPAILTINNNIISGDSTKAIGAGFLYGIYNTGAATTTTISNNLVSGNTTGLLTTGLFVGIYNAGATPTLNIKGNSFSGNSTTTVSGVHYSIYNSGAVTTAINIDSNIIGTGAGTSGAITFNSTSANTGAQIGINNTGGGATAALSISNNSFQGINYTVAGTGNYTLISNTVVTKSQAIDTNTFTNLSVNTAGNFTFIANNVAGTTQDISGNAISGTFAKTAAGDTLTLYSRVETHSSTGSTVNNNNNFSNITVSGATIIAGWVNTDAGTTTKNIQNNVFSNWTSGTGAITVLTTGIAGTNAISGNTIKSMFTAGAITGISTGAGNDNDNIFSNVIDTLYSTGASVNGIAVTAGFTKNIYKNKIYDLQAGGATGSVNGILVASTLRTVNIYNNLIGALRAPAGDSATDLVRGISITTTVASSTISVYYNTIYLNASSTGTNFSTSGIYHVASATATTAVLNMRNNIIANYSTPSGSGLTVALRRSAATLGNFATTSNNNLLYAGTPGAQHLIYYDNSNSYQTITTYKAAVTSRETFAVTEDVATKFLSTTGGSASYLHINPILNTIVEGGAVNITGYTTDYDGDIRQGNPGYTGSGAAPDIGADEFNDQYSPPPLSGSYTVGTGGDFTSLTEGGGLFAIINQYGLSGNVTVNVISDLAENGTNQLNQWTEQGAGGYTLTIQPSTATPYLISGSAATPLIGLNGADRVTFDGSFAGTGNYFTIRNTNTTGATGTAFSFINGATNNTLQYCNIEAYANVTNGVVLFSTSTVAGGNSNNLVTNCNINATVAGHSGTIAIFSAGTAGKENTTNTISNNNIFNYTDRGLGIAATGSTAWAITGNNFYNGDVSAGINYTASDTLFGIRVQGGAGYTIQNNYIGGDTALAGGTMAAYASTAGMLSYEGIQLTTTSATPASSIKGNTITNISVSAAPNVAGAYVFTGIETNGSGISIGGSLNGDGNLIGSNTANTALSVTTTTAGTTFKTNIYGINCNSAGGLITGNQVGGLDITNIGSNPAPSSFYGISTGGAISVTPISNNIIGSSGTGAVSNSIRVLSSSLSTTTTLTGVNIAATVTSAVAVTGNKIQNISYQSTTTGTGSFTGINSSAITPAVISISNDTISNNTMNMPGGTFYGISGSNVTGNATSLTISGNSISNNTSTAATTGLFVGIYNAGAAATLNITGNTFSGNSITAVSGVHYSIYNSGAVTTAINIDSNIIGTGAGTSGAITFNSTSANTGAQIGINNTGGGATAALSISNNSFQGINYTVAGTGNYTLISNTVVTKSQAIDTNTFTNLSVNTAGNFTFIANNVAGTTQDISGNAISGTFAKTAAGGTLTLYSRAELFSSSGAINNSNNNFSNITVSGATIIAGWVNTDAGGATKNIQNNVFSNWTSGTGAITVLTTGIAGTNAISGNTIKSMFTAGAITGISTGAGNDRDNIFSNIIDTLYSTGASVNGIAVTAGFTKNIYKNKIYDLQAGGATSSVNGISVTGTPVTINIYNNLIGALRAPAGNSATVDLVRGISITATNTSTTNVYYNTIYLNAASTGTTFSTSGIYHTASTVANTAVLNMRNNIIANYSTPSGSGLTVALRRSAATLGNFATTSNNNLLYAGTPGAQHLVYYDGTTGYQTLVLYKAASGFTPRETAAVTEDVATKFLGTTGGLASYLHINPTLTTLVESGAVNISGYTDDYDGQIRAGNSGYIGTSLSPDIGADEIYAIETVPPTIAYIVLTDTTGTANRALDSVTITDASGVNVTTGTKPRIYYKRFSDANTVADNTSATNGWKYTETTGTTTPFNFTIDYTLLYGGAAVTAGVIQYFVVAQDQVVIPNVAINSGTFADTPASVALTAAAFPITGTINSYNIPFSGNYNVGNAEIFTSLTKANGLFASVNAAGLSGNVTFSITSDLSEDGTDSLSQWTESGAGNYNMVIQPDGATLRTISGDAVNGLIRLSGANRVRIDGSNGGGGEYLAFKNLNTTGTTGTAFSFSNGASNDTIRYCSAEAYANAANGVVLFGTSTVTGGNSNNQVTNCDIIGTTGGNTSNVCIYSAGSVGFENSTNTISNNNIYNYRDRGIDITATGSTAWAISGNNLYNGDIAGTINYAAASTLHGIRILGGGGYTLLNNFIGGNAVNAEGVNAVLTSSGNLCYQGILLTTSSATPVSNIKGNTINHISISEIPTTANTATFIGIETNGSGINIGGTSPGDGNTIGSNTVNSAILVTTTTTVNTNTSIIRGINCNSTGGLITGNQVGGLDIKNIGAAPAASTFTGIYFNSTTAPSTVDSNIIGSTGTGAALNSIRVLSTSTALAISLNGIVAGTSLTGSVTINGNTIKNISNLSTTSSGSFTGINNSGTATSSLAISNNKISTISAAANASTSSTLYTGILSAAPSVISADTITGITLLATGTAAQIAGIHVSGAYAHTISGNTLSSFTTASTKTADIESGAPSGFDIVGILNEASVTGQVISGNNLSGFNASSTAATNTAVSGIAIATSGSTGNIYNNKINTFSNTATGTAVYPGISGIMAANGAFNVYNNSINISNGNNTNGVKIYGINHATTNNYNYYYNSIYISGISNAVTRSATFIRTVAGTLSVKDNVFVNIRDGNGNDYAISNITTTPATNWTAATADYNDIYSNAPSTNTGEWGTGVNKTFAAWKTISGGDAHSVNTSISLAGTTADVQPDSTTNCFLSNKGISVTTPVAITTDINGAARSGSTPDIGAYEFNYSQFIINASSNSPVCAGSTVSLTVDIGTAINPSYSWRDPLFVIVDTTQDPVLPAVAGNYKITVTDVNGCIGTDSTVVAINARPTVHFTGSASSVCDGSSVNLELTVTGTGTINGTTNAGDVFSGTAPSIAVPVSPDTTITYRVISLSDDNCTSIPTDMPDSFTIKITHAGDWLGTVSNDWNDPDNWCGGIPAPSTNVTIYSGTSTYPTVSSGTATTNDLTLQNGTSLTVANAALYISGNITDAGTLTAATGTIDFNGDSTQYIGPGLFAGNTISNLTIENTDSVILGGTLNITGVLTPTNGIFNTSTYLNLISTAAQTALIDGSASAGTVLGTVTMQRYLASGFGYRYISSPFQAATVGQLSGYINLSDSFPLLYTYDESKVSSGWTSDTASANILSPLVGFAANFGASSSATTLQLKGTVTDGPVSATLFNHNQTYTQGFNLVGNPYPSPIDWNAGSGFTRTNIDNAVYYFNASATDQFGGTYSSYINGISSDGVANNIIPAMQGFFVHVTNGTFPVTATLSLSNTARINNLAPVYHRATNDEQQHPLLRLVAQSGDNTTNRDAMVVYFDDSASDNYDQQFDALKLMNTDAKVPSLYAAPADDTKLSINAIATPGDSDRTVPLTIETSISGPVLFSASDMERMPYGLHAYFADAQTGDFKDLETTTGYRVQLDAGKYERRFYLVFSHEDVITIPGTEEKLIAYNTGENVFVYMSGEKGTIVIYNALGQVTARQDVTGKGYHLVQLHAASGVYVITLYSEKGKLSKKLFIGSE